MERPPREIYPLLGELLKYDRKSEKWEELEWKGVVNKPILYKKCECSLKNVKEFVNKLEIFSKEFPLYWV